MSSKNQPWMNKKFPARVLPANWQKLDFAGLGTSRSESVRLEI